jgi:His-Xaa-Ser system protein HxsD
MTIPTAHRAVLELDTAIYRVAAIKKAAYKFGGRCLVTIALVTERKAELTIVCHDTGVDVQQLVREIHCEVSDQELREVVLEETAGIRNLLLAQAFSATSLIDPTGAAADYENDPLGITSPDAGPTPRADH